jgi:DNA-binding MarR family transcriptional regulator
VYIHAMSRPDPAAIEAIATLCACRNVRRAARAVTGLYDRILAPAGLRATQVTLLVALEKAGPIPSTRLAGVLGMDRTTLTRNLEPLRRAGLLTLRPGEDRRVRLATITQKGRNSLTAAIPLWEQAQREITDGLGRGRWDAVRRDLQQLTALAGESLSPKGADA